MERWPDYLSAASAGLRDLIVTSRGGETLTAADGFARWVAMTRDGRAARPHIYLVGNGASADDGQPHRRRRVQERRAARDGVQRRRRC